MFVAHEVQNKNPAHLRLCVQTLKCITEFLCRSCKWVFCDILKKDVKENFGWKDVKNGTDVDSYTSATISISMDFLGVIPCKMEPYYI